MKMFDKLPKFNFANRILLRLDGADAGGGGGSSSPAVSATPSGTSAAPATPDVSGSGSAPAEAPSTPDAPPAADLDASAFDGLGESEPDDSVPAVPEVVPPPAVVAPAAAPQVPPAPVAPAPAAVQPPAQPTAPQAPVPPLSPAEPAKIAEQMAANEDALVAHIAQTQFALSPEDLEALETDVPNLLPKMMAKVYVKMTQNFLRQLETSVPAIVKRVNEVGTRNSTNENKFYDAWKEHGVDKAKHGEIVNKVAQVWRQLNPNASLDDMVKAIGPIVIQQAGIVKPAPSAPAAPSLAPGSTKISPFTPAGPGSASPIPSAPVADMWSGLGGSDE